MSLHKTNGTLGQKGKGHKIMHHSSLIKKSLTGDSSASQLIPKNQCTIFNHFVNFALLGNFLLKMGFDCLVEKLYRNMSLSSTIVSKRHKRC